MTTTPTSIPPVTEVGPRTGALVTLQLHRDDDHATFQLRSDLRLNRTAAGQIMRVLEDRLNVGLAALSPLGAPELDQVDRDASTPGRITIKRHPRRAVPPWRKRCDTLLDELGEIVEAQLALLVATSKHPHLAAARVIKIGHGYEAAVVRRLNTDASERLYRVPTELRLGADIEILVLRWLGNARRFTLVGVRDHQVMLGGPGPSTDEWWWQTERLLEEALTARCGFDPQGGGNPDWLPVIVVC